MPRLPITHAYIPIEITVTFIKQPERSRSNWCHSTLHATFTLYGKQLYSVCPSESAFSSHFNCVCRSVMYRNQKKHTQLDIEGLMTAEWLVLLQSHIKATQCTKEIFCTRGCIICILQVRIIRKFPQVTI